jgi:hypothetical protein
VFVFLCVFTDCRVAYFNIVKSEMKKILSIVSLHGQEAIRHMREAQRWSLRSLGALESVRFGSSWDDGGPGGGGGGGGGEPPPAASAGTGASASGKSTKSSGTGDALNLSNMLDMTNIYTSGPTRSCCDLSPPALCELQAQICGLFWSYRVLSRLYMFEDSGAHNCPPGSRDVHPVIEELTRVPQSVWATVGLVITDYCLPLTAVGTTDNNKSPSFSGNIVRNASFIANNEDVSCGSEEVSAGEEAFLLCLGHLLKAHECIYVRPPAHLQRAGTAPPVDPQPASSRSGCGSSFVLLPIPRTSTLCVFELSRQHIPRDTAAASATNAAAPPPCNWLIVSQRAVDVSDVVNKLASHYHIRPLTRLLSPVSEACLQQPSLQMGISNQYHHSSAEDQHRHAPEYPMDPYAPAPPPPSLDWACPGRERAGGWRGGQSQPLLPVLGTLLEHQAVRKVVKDIFFAALASFFFFPPQILLSSSTSQEHLPASRSSDSSEPSASESTHVTPPCVVHSAEVASLRSVGGELADHIICCEDVLLLSGDESFSFPGAQEMASLTAGLRPPLAADVIESFISSSTSFLSAAGECLGGGGKKEGSAEETPVLCFRFVMNKRDGGESGAVFDENFEANRRSNTGHEDVSGVNNSRKSDDDVYGYYADHLFGICLLSCGGASGGHKNQDDSFSLVSCIFEGSQICGNEKHLTGNPVLFHQMSGLKDSHHLISVGRGSEAEMLQGMKASITHFCHQMVKVFYNNAAWKQLLGSSAQKDMTTSVVEPDALEGGGNGVSVSALCMGGHQVHLPLATIFAYSHTQQLIFLDFLLPSLALFSSVHNATFLYNLFLKSFKSRVFFMIPDHLSRNASGRAFHFIISGESSVDPYFLHIEVGVDSRCEVMNEDNDTFVDASAGAGAACPTSGKKVSVSLVEAHDWTSSKSKQPLDYSSSGDHDYGVNVSSNHLNCLSDHHSPQRQRISRGTISSDSGSGRSGEGEWERKRSSHRMLIESVVNIVLYASNILLAQQ